MAGCPAEAGVGAREPAPGTELCVGWEIHRTPARADCAFIMPPPHQQGGKGPGSTLRLGSQVFILSRWVDQFVASHLGKEEPGPTVLSTGIGADARKNQFCLP